jgi:hypothetical protein
LGAADGEGGGPTIDPSRDRLKADLVVGKMGKTIAV